MTEVSETDMRFTGQREEPGVDPALGLYNYKARFYSTVLGRFVSADPLTVDGLNRYAYVRNNPLRWMDPSGLCHAGGPDCPSPAPTPSPSATPTPGGYELDVCAMHVLGCLLLGAAQFGIAENGLVIVLGMFNSIPGNAGDWEDWVKEFFTRYGGSCQANVNQCWDLVEGLIENGAGSDVVFNTFGVKFIESDPGYGPVPAILV